MPLTDFIKADPKFTSGSSYLVGRDKLGDEPREETGDFLARLWTLFGAPDSVDYEGFSYSIKHSPTGKMFTAYCAGSGPAYGGKHDQDVLAIVTEFNTLLRQVPLANCKIKFETDFGWFEAGATNDVPFQNPIAK